MCQLSRRDLTININAKLVAPDLRGMKPATMRYLVIVIAISTITISYWVAADPPNPWILAIAAAGILVTVGITIAKVRAGHFDKSKRDSGLLSTKTNTVSKVSAFWFSRPLHAVVRRQLDEMGYFEYLPMPLKEEVCLSSGLFRILTQYSSLTSSSISTMVE